MRPIKGRSTAVEMNPPNPHQKFWPEATPVARGRYKLPAPKNIEKIAKAAVIIIEVVLFMRKIPCYLLARLKIRYIQKSAKEHDTDLQKKRKKISLESLCS